MEFKALLCNFLNDDEQKIDFDLKIKNAPVI